MANESIEFDIKVNGKPAKDSIEDVEKAQNELDGTVEKTSKSIKMNWKAIGVSVAAVGVAMGALMKSALDLEKAMFGLNDQTKKWIQYASSKYGVDQKIIAGFLQTGKTAGMAGDEIEKMIDQAVALGRAYPHESTESFIDNLTMLNRTGEAQGYIVDILEQKYGTIDLKTISLADKMKTLEDATRGVNEAYDETDAAKAEKALNDMGIAADSLGTSLLTLASEAGIFDTFAAGMNWIKEKTVAATEALKNYNSEATKTGGGGGGGSWGPDLPLPDGKPKIDVEGKPKPTTLSPFAPNITKQWIDQQVAANQKILAEQKRASEERAREAKRAGDKAAAERESLYQEKLAANEQFWDDYNRTTMTEYEYESSLLDKQYEEYKQHVEDKAALDTWYAEQKKLLLEQYDEQMQAYAEMGDALTDGLTRGIINFTETGKMNFKDMANSIIQDMIKIQIQSSMMSLMGGFGSGGGGLLGSLFGGLFSQGAAFSNGNVTAFANGGVVGSPTLFPMANGAGLMGEAGPEAIVPLTRTSGGDLGVKATAPVVNVNVQNYGNDEVKVQQNGDNINVIISQIASSIQRGTGEIGTAIEGRYGVRKV